MKASKLTRKINKFGFVIKKRSPEIFIAVGALGTVAGLVLACKETLKVTEVLEETKETLDRIHTSVDLDMTEEGSVRKYTEEDAKEDTVKLYAKTAVKMAEIYWPMVVVSAASVACFLSANGIMRKRNAAIVSAYASVDAAFKKYRNNIKEKYGEDADKTARFGVSQETVDTPVGDGSTKQVSTKTVTKYDLAYSDYAKFFDSASVYWSKDPEENLQFLKTVEANANVLLMTKGFLYLNEVYEALGIPETNAGKVVGWMYDEKNPVGDNFIDFGLYGDNSPAARAFINGTENVFLLDFNVDGVINF